MFAAAITLAAALSGPAAWGRTAPDFTLPTADGKQISLSAFRGKLVVIEFMQPT